MKNLNSWVFLLFSTAFCANFASPNAQIETITIDTKTEQLRITIPLNRDEYIYADTVTFSVDKPGITLSKWNSSSEQTLRFDQQYHASKRVIAGTPVFTLTVSRNDEKPVPDASLRLIYYTNKGKTALESFFPLSFWAPAQPTPVSAAPEGQPDLSKTSEEQQAPQRNSFERTSAPAHVPEQNQSSDSWSNYLTSTIEHSHSLWIQLLFAVLLGLLMSLTPCIYPMVPITMGILQAHGACSIVRNFLLALSYTIGIATTFAMLGLTAALAGHLMGGLLTHPLVIIVIIALLLYVAFSLFGFYNLYMPRSLTSRRAGTCTTGGYITAFLFGAVSGTIASPCLSPGIIFMLTLVAALKSVFIGFALLFAFGIGLSLPLLLIGTFSTSMSLLPRAGSWMEEIKYIFGFMMLGMCCYFLTSLVPLYVTQAILAILCFAAGIFYLIHSKQFKETWQRIWGLFGMLLITGSVVIASYSIKTYVLPIAPQSTIAWVHDYPESIELANKEQKKVFIFVHAPLCIACDELEKTLNANDRFIRAIKKWVAVSINLNDNTEGTKHFIEHYKIIGAPNCILVDPVNESVIQRWDYELSAEQLAQLVSMIEAA